MAYNRSGGARPGGLSDEDSASDLDDFEISNFQKNSQGNRSAVGSSSSQPNYNNNFPTASNNDLNNPLIIPYNSTNNNDGSNEVEDWENEEDSSSSPRDTSDNNVPSIFHQARIACSRGELEKLQSLLLLKNKSPGENSLESNKSKTIDVSFINWKFADESTLLMTAAANGRANIVCYLLTLDANPGLLGNLRMTALLCAVSCIGASEEDVLSCVQALHGAGADLNHRNGRGLSALLLCTQRDNRLRVMEYLLSNGADINQVDYTGKTALIHAAECGRGAYCRFLIERGADVGAVDDGGYTAYDIANDRGFHRLADFLFKVKSSVWLPGLHPQLMLEENRVGKFAEGDSNIELLLSSVEPQYGAIKYLDNFARHKISWFDFLTLEDEDLKEIGVDEVGVRQFLLSQIKNTHAEEYNSKSIQLLTDKKKLTASETVCILHNMRTQLAHMNSTLIYLSKRLKREPDTLKFGKNRHKVENMIKLCEEICRSNVKVDGNVEKLGELLVCAQQYPELQLGDELPVFLPANNKKNVVRTSFNPLEAHEIPKGWNCGTRNSKKRRKKKIFSILIGLTLIGGTVFAYLYYTPKDASSTVDIVKV